MGTTLSEFTDFVQHAEKLLMAEQNKSERLRRENEQLWAQLAAMPFARGLVQLQPGEAKPDTPLLSPEPPDGFRWETDQELRARIQHR
jgi:hypothetical protein